MTTTELELIAARDHDAMARFYDRHVAMVGEFCAAVCPDERVDEAVAAVFVNFLGRATVASQASEPEELLRRAAREVAASRMEGEGSPVDERADPVCRAMPELLAARINGELRGQSGPVADHLSGCATCQATAARLGQAEVLFPVGSAGGVTELRSEWLELAAATNTAATAEPQPSAPAGEPQPSAATAEPQPTAPAAQPTGAQEPPPVLTSEREPPGGPPTRGRVRRGGLVSAVRRLAGPTGAEPPGPRPGDAGN